MTRPIRLAALLLLASATTATAQDTRKSVRLARPNPFFTESRLPYHAVPFDRIRSSDYQPAIEEGIRQEEANVTRIANQKAPATFANTIVPMENSGPLLERVQLAFNAVTGANTNDTLQAAETALAPKLAAHYDAIALNPKLFARVQRVYDNRDKANLTAEQKRLVERYYTNFVRGGARLSDADKARLRALNKEESELSTEFSRRLRSGTRDAAVVVDDASQLAGLSPSAIAAAAAAAAQRGLSGKWVLPLQNTTQQPSQVSLQNRAMRQRLFEASIHRTDKGDSNDTRAVIARLAQLRAEKAAIMGYPNYSAFRLADQGAGTPENATKLLADIGKASVAKAQAELARMQQEVDRQGGNFKIEPWDWQYYAEQVRKADYALDEDQVKQYFVLDSVLKNGVFYAAEKMYGITFKPRRDIPVYHPDVRVFEVIDSNGQPLALFYADYFKRDNKNGGAWMDNMVLQARLRGTKPVVYNVCNFTKPAAGQPALISFSDVTTMFHEFGHAVHGIFSNGMYPSISNTNTPRDFVEFPSQFNEAWATEPTVFAHYAKHYQTGAPMPGELVEKIKKAGTFNEGFATTEYVAASLLDIAYHLLPANTPKPDIDTFEKEALVRYGVAMAEIPPRYRSTYFAHIFGGGYASSYYAYLWTDVLAEDAAAWFNEHGGMTRANGQRYRDLVLSRGSIKEAAQLYRDFAGRDPRIEPLLLSRGLTTPR